MTSLLVKDRIKKIFQLKILPCNIKLNIEEECDTTALFNTSRNIILPDV